MFSSILSFFGVKQNSAQSRIHHTSTNGPNNGTHAGILRPSAKEQLLAGKRKREQDESAAAIAPAAVANGASEHALGMVSVDAAP